MLFNSYEFIFLFLPVSLLVFPLLARHHHRLAAAWLALAPLGFYAYGNLAFVALLLASIAFNYLLERLFRQALRTEENAKIYLKKTKGSLTLGDFAHLHTIFDMAVQSGSNRKPLIFRSHGQIFALFEAARRYWKGMHFKKPLGDIVLAQMCAPSGGFAPLAVGKTRARQTFWLQLSKLPRALNHQPSCVNAPDVCSHYPKLFAETAKSPLAVDFNRKYF